MHSYILGIDLPIISIVVSIVEAMLSGPYNLILSPHHSLPLASVSSSQCFKELSSLFAGDADLDRVFQLPPTTYIGGEETKLPLREIIHRLEVASSSLTLSTVEFRIY